MSTFLLGFCESGGVELRVNYHFLQLYHGVMGTWIMMLTNKKMFKVVKVKHMWNP